MPFELERLKQPEHVPQRDAEGASSGLLLFWLAYAPARRTHAHEDQRSRSWSTRCALAAKSNSTSDRSRLIRPTAQSWRANGNADVFGTSRRCSPTQTTGPTSCLPSKPGMPAIRTTGDLIGVARAMAKAPGRKSPCVQTVTRHLVCSPQVRAATRSCFEP